MNRIEHEDAIIAMLREALPENVEIAATPLGPNDRRFLDVKSAAIRVVYEGGKPRAGQERGSGLHAEDWTWSVIVLAKDYRSTQSGAIAALGVLEAVIAALNGKPLGAGKLLRLGDQFLQLPPDCGLMGYEARFSINAFAPRG